MKLKNKAGRHKRLPESLYLLELVLSVLDRTQATSTNGDGLVFTVNGCLYLADVGLPTSVGLTMGVRNGLSENNTLSTNAALCHF